MECPCNRCNGQDELAVFFGNAPEPAEEKESVYQRLCRLHNQLLDSGVKAELLNELEDITREVDRIDDEIWKLQRATNRKSKESIQIQLGEISKKVY